MSVALVHVPGSSAPQRPVRAAHPKQNVKAALQEWLEAKGFDDTYDADYRISLLKTDWKLDLGQQPGIQEALRAHDLHHVATGYGTDWRGEVEISAWEAGAKGPLLERLLFGSVALLGVLLGPARVWRAFQAGRRGQSLYGNNAATAAVLGMNVGQLRQQLGVPLQGLANDAP